MLKQEDITNAYFEYAQKDGNRLIYQAFEAGARWAEKELVHEPDNEDGITAAELRHQLYGYNLGKKEQL